MRPINLTDATLARMAGGQVRFGTDRAKWQGHIELVKADKLGVVTINISWMATGKGRRPRVWREWLRGAEKPIRIKTPYAANELTDTSILIESGNVDEYWDGIVLLPPDHPDCIEWRKVKPTTADNEKEHAVISVLGGEISSSLLEVLAGHTARAVDKNLTLKDALEKGGFKPVGPTGLKFPALRAERILAKSMIDDSIEGLEADLDSLLEVCCKVARGEQTVEGMGKFISLNYPKFRKKLPKEMRVLPPKRRERAR